MNIFIFLVLFFFFFLTEYSVNGKDVDDNLKPSRRIAGGDLATKGQYSYHVAILRQNIIRPKQYIYTCGGSIVHLNFILTAAHCVLGLNPKQLLVQATIDLRDDPFWESATRTIWIHSLYDDNISFFAKNDIALLQTVKAAYHEKGFVYSVNLPLNNNDALGWWMFPDSPILPTGVIAGFGEESSNGLIWEYQQLSGITVNILDFNTCHEYYDDFDEKYNFCTSSKDGDGKTKQACGGDVGSGLVFTPGNILIGVVVTGYDCDGKYPNILVPVKDHMTWIYRSISDGLQLAAEGKNITAS